MKHFIRLYMKRPCSFIILLQWFLKLTSDGKFLVRHHGNLPRIYRLQVSLISLVCKVEIKFRPFILIYSTIKIRNINFYLNGFSGAFGI